MLLPLAVHLLGRLQQIYLVLEGGLVQGAWSPTPELFADTEVIVLDYDTDGIPMHHLTEVTQDDEVISRAWVNYFPIGLLTVKVHS